jgi:hypothetical protein
MLLAQVVYRDYRVRRKRWWWWWWDARTRKLGGGRGLPCQTENRVHMLTGPSKFGGGRLHEHVHSHVDIAVEVIGSYVGENKHPAVNINNELIINN